MNKPSPRRAFACLVVLLFASVQLVSAKVASFKPYAGTYNGTLTVDATFETFSTPVKIVIVSTRKGKTATVTITGDAEGQPVKTIYKFGKKRSLSHRPPLCG